MSQERSLRSSEGVPHSTTVLTALASLLLAAEGPLPTAALWHERVVIADGTGVVRAWKLDATVDKPLTHALAATPIIAIVRAGEVLWGFTTARPVTWSEERSTWVDTATKVAPAPCLAFAVVDGAPVGLCGPGVFRFTDGRSWPAPKPDVPITDTGFGVPRAVASRGATLAIGTGYGEWGGTLWTLDLATGRWAHHFDELACVTGLSWGTEGLLVTWSMSHFSASTRVRLHRADASVVREGSRLDGKYLRAIAAEGDWVTALEQNTLVRVKPDLTFSPIGARLALPYGAEPLAVGVSSGIAVMLPVPGHRVLVVSAAGQGVLAGAGAVTPLKAP